MRSAISGEESLVLGEVCDGVQVESAARDYLMRKGGMVGTSEVGQEVMDQASIVAKW